MNLDLLLTEKILSLHETRDVQKNDASPSSSESAFQPFNKEKKVPKKHQKKVREVKDIIQSFIESGPQHFISDQKAPKSYQKRIGAVVDTPEIIKRKKKYMEKITENTVNNTKIFTAKVSKRIGSTAYCQFQLKKHFLYSK